MSTEAKHIEKKKKLSPKLRFKEFKGQWKLTKLSQLLEFKNGINASKEQYGSGFKFINVLDILNNDFIMHDSIIGSVDVDKSIFEKYLVNFGDILFQRSSETREEVGTASVYLDSKPATFGGFVIRGKKIGVYDPMFLNKLLKTDLSRNEITSKSGGSTRYNVGQETLSSVALPFPSLPEQQKIASFLSAVDEKIQQLTRKKELLEQYKKGVMQQLFTSSALGLERLKDDRISEDENNPTIPKSHKSKFRQLRFKDENGKPYPKWEEKKLGEIADIYDGTHQTPTYVENGVPFYSVEHVTANDFSNTKFISEEVFNKENLKVRLEKGDILMTRIGDIGTARLIDWDVKASFYVSLALIKTKDDLSAEFVSQYIHSRNFQLELWQRTIHVAFPKKINLGEIGNCHLLVPSKEEQQKIANFLTALDTKIESVASQVSRVQEFKKGLLQQMFV
jgi:type I restriction enzyme S subunit